MEREKMGKIKKNQGINWEKQSKIRKNKAKFLNFPLKFVLLDFWYFWIFLSNLLIFSRKFDI